MRKTRKQTRRNREYMVWARRYPTSWGTPISRERALSLVKRHGQGTHRGGWNGTGADGVRLDCCPTEHAFARAQGANEFYVSIIFA